MKTLFLIDGSAYSYRAFYAIGNLRTSAGQPTNAVYGFIKMLQKLIETYQPSHLAVVFDKGKPTFRHEQYEGYKAHRKPMPDELISQLPWIKKIINASNIQLLEKEGYEADDIIATLAVQGEKEGYEVRIASSDKDMLQLVNGKIKVIRSVKEDIIYDQDKVIERYGIRPEQIPDLLAIVGDSSDNIPGLAGVGEKTGAKLLKDYGNVAALIAEAETIKKDRIKNAVRESKEQLQQNLSLVTVKKDVPLDIGPGECRFKLPQTDRLKDIYRELEFKGLLLSLHDKGKADLPGNKPSRNISNQEQWQSILAELKGIARFSIVARDRQPALAYEKGGRLQGISLAAEEALLADIWQGLAELLSNKSLTVYGHELKSIMKICPVKAAFFDTSLAAYLLQPSAGDYSISALCLKYLGEIRGIATGDELAEAAVANYKLVEVLEKEMIKKRLFDVYRRLELPLIGVLAEMEKRGIKINVSVLTALSAELGDELKELTVKIYQEAGEEFNINSHKHLEKLLFTKLALPKGKKTKTGYSTDVEVLEQLKKNHPLPGRILEYRQLSKLKSTYLDPLPQQIDFQQRLHTTFNQTGTATGRLSSSEPNLQNIPIKTELGRRVRRAFIPEAEEWYLLAADYSQIELRILAHLSGDKVLINAFNNNEDIHSATAREVFGEVNPETRRQAKMINFGIVYGMGAKGLARSLDLPVKEAQDYINAYFKRYPGVAMFIKDTLAEAKIYGYVTNMFGRKRWLPELLSPKPQLQAFGERAAINTPIQGAAADIIKTAMINISRRLERQRLTANMLLQIHDELIFEAAPDNLEKLQLLVKDEMENSAELKVPLRVEIKTGKTWAEL